ncbi:DNA-dependent metalloprotease SPRTN isoform X2 [Drosophila willistoni]|uniref:DNA-dependent metalloprotease SPRTN isoform X2 n=1 Tax=Drosophila willistoni TaxID=7260 RepID=UPI000C26CC41|nr:DNA-dependent metalloprotease SPRTN isoform X2 [Drosophila willistoni]
MSDNDDYLFALKLQQQLNEESPESNNTTNQASKKRVTNEPTNSSQADFELAVQLQAQLNAESDADSEDDGGFKGLPGASGASDLDSSIQFVYSGQTNAVAKAKPSASRGESDYLNQTQNLVHPEWELIDPTPDISSMFVQFDDKFFQKRLGAVVIEWSKRMYSCAGICYQRGNRYFKEIIIRLSEPLLKLRPRKDLVETMLHEMIHAYCFVLNIREGNGGHGPNFKRIMNTINKVAGTNITVYHTFHDEVDAYRTHIWRCTGICQNHTPFQGWVKRTSNRAPGPSDQWWEKHQRECGGTFMKVSQPPPPSRPAKEPAKSSKGKKAISNQPATSSSDDIRNYFEKPPAKRPAFGVSSSAKPVSQLASIVPPSSYPGLSSDPFALPKQTAAAPKVFSFSDFTNDRSPTEVRGGKLGNGVFGIRSPPREMSGQGYTLANSAGDIENDPPEPDISKKTTESQPKDSSKPDADTSKTNKKRSRESNEDDNEIVGWESYDDDIMVRDVVATVINISDSDDDDDDDNDKKVKKEKPSQEQVPSPRSCSPISRNLPISSQERTRNIKREVMADESLRFSDEDILMIDDEYDDAVDRDDENLLAATELADQSILDEFFGEDTLIQEYQRENDVIPSGSRYHHNVNNDIVSCPICFEKMKRSQLSNHLEGCSITIRIEPPSFKPKTIVKQANTNTSINTSSTKNNSSKANPSTKTKSRSSGTSAKARDNIEARKANDSIRPRTRSVTLLSSSEKRMTRQSSKREILKQSGYTDREIAELNLSSSSANTSFSDEDQQLTPRQRRQRNLFKKTTPCPRCGQELMGHQLEAHGKLCTKKRRSRFK